MKTLLSLTLALCLVTPLTAHAQEIPSLRASDACIKFIKACEGFSANAYEDGQNWAIGYGTHVNPEAYNHPISEETADDLFLLYLTAIEESLNKKLSDVIDSLNQNEFDALVSFSYNLGTGWAKKGNGLYELLVLGARNFNANRTIQTFGMFCRADGKPVLGLAKRRLAEGKMFYYGDYSFGGTPEYRIEICNETDESIKYSLTGHVTESFFSDVGCDDWYYKYVSPLAYLKIVCGYGENLFEPNSCVTNGEALKMIILSANFPQQTETCSPWSLNYLEFAHRTGIASEEEIATDMLNEPITRAMAARIAQRAMALEKSNSATPFNDTEDQSVIALYEAGIITGSYSQNGEPMFFPNDNLTRGELSAIVWRIRCQ